MKILLGSHGVGKSTLLQEVQKHFKDYFITDGFSRPVMRISKKLDFSKTEIQVSINELTVWAYKNYLAHSNLISTRSIVDCIIYSQILCPNLSVKEMEDLFKETVDQIEWFFYIPIEFEFIQDPERLDEVLQKKVDNLLVKFIDQYIPKDKLVVLRGSIDERLDTIKKYL